jgi:hypothetical protein
MAIGERIEQILKTAGALVAVAGFVWGVYQYFDNRDRELENAQVEARRPFLDRQMTLYTDATRAVALIATSEDAAERANAEQRFWELYWGELALVEDSRVEAAMVAFKNGLVGKAGQPKMQQLSLDLAHACRDSLAEAWGVELWRRPGAQSVPQD